MQCCWSRPAPSHGRFVDHNFAEDTDSNCEHLSKDGVEDRASASSAAIRRHTDASHGEPSLLVYALLDLPGEEVQVEGTADGNGARASRNGAGRSQPRARHLPPNTPEGVPLDNSNFAGKALWMQRPPGGGMHPYYQHFEGRKRQWEARIQGRFLRVPKGQMFIGLVLRDFNYNQSVAPHSRMVQRAGMLLVNRDYDLYLSWGARCRESGKPDAELSHLVTNMTGWDQIVVTKPGDTPPSLTGDLTGLGLERNAMARGDYTEAVQNLYKEINTVDTFTFCFWGVSPFLSAVDWHIKCAAATISMEQFMEQWPIHCVMYELAPPKEPGSVTSHFESRKRYYLDFVFWANKVDCAHLSRRYTFLDAAAYLEGAAASSALKVSKDLKSLVDDFSETDWNVPYGCLQELLSACLMPFPVVYAYSILLQMPRSGECSGHAWSMFSAMVAQLPFSMSYHGVLAVNASRARKIDDTPWRCLDQTFIHVGCTVGAMGLSRSPGYSWTVAVPFNMYAVAMLWYSAFSEARHLRFVRMTLAIVIFLLPLAGRGDWHNFFGSSLSFTVGAMFFVSDRQLGGWGHSVFHAMLIPYAHFVFHGMFSIS